MNDLKITLGQSEVVFATSFLIPAEKSGFLNVTFASIAVTIEGQALHFGLKFFRSPEPRGPTVRWRNHQGELQIEFEGWDLAPMSTMENPGKITELNGVPLGFMAAVQYAAGVYLLSFQLLKGETYEA